MKSKVNQIVAAIIVAVITTVSVFSMTAKSDTQSSKNYKSYYAQGDSTDGNGSGNDSTDGSGGIGIPIKE